MEVGRGRMGEAIGDRPRGVLGHTDGADGHQPWTTTDDGLLHILAPIDLTARTERMTAEMLMLLMLLMEVEVLLVSELGLALVGELKTGETGGGMGGVWHGRDGCKAGNEHRTGQRRQTGEEGITLGWTVFRGRMRIVGECSGGWRRGEGEKVCAGGQSLSCEVCVFGRVGEVVRAMRGVIDQAGRRT